MRQKARLLNLAVEAVPRACEKIARLECELVFPDVPWGKRASAMLDKFPLVQPFSVLREMPKQLGSPVVDRQRADAKVSFRKFEFDPSRDIAVGEVGLLVLE